MKRAWLVLALCANASADDWVSPTEVTLTSPNGKLTAVITPSSGKGKATALVGKKKFTLADDVMPVDSVLFDDGRLLTFDHWHSLGFGKVATLYDKTGKVKWTKTLEKLIGKTLIDRASHSVSSIWWRKTPLEWSLAEDGKSGTLTLFDENQLSVTLSDGSTSVVPISNLPADPPRLINRARALSGQPAMQAEVIALLERALAKDPTSLEAVQLEVDVLQASGDHAAVVALLDRFSPKWTTKDTSVANACVSWAKSLEALKRVPEAEQKLRLGIAAAPQYSNPVIALATLLFTQNRVKDSDAVLDDFVKRLFAAPSLDEYALSDVADFYHRNQQLPKAMAVYLKGYKKDEVTNQFLYASLAQLYEEMGDDVGAIRVQEQLLAYFQKMGTAFDTYTKSTRDALARLRAKKKPPVR